MAEYAKASPDDILIQVTVANRGPDPATIHLLPTLWFRKTWGFEWRGRDYTTRPQLTLEGPGQIGAVHETLGRLRLRVGEVPGSTGLPQILFTENETNTMRVIGAPPSQPYVKRCVPRVRHPRSARSRQSLETGTKAAPLYVLAIPAGGEAVVRLRLTAEAESARGPFDAEFERVVDLRRAEANAFYDTHTTSGATPAERAIARQAHAGLQWSKQFYHYVVETWLDGDGPEPAVAAAAQGSQQ